MSLAFFPNRSLGRPVGLPTQLDLNETDVTSPPAAPPNSVRPSAEAEAAVLSYLQLEQRSTRLLVYPLTGQPMNRMGYRGVKPDGGGGKGEHRAMHRRKEAR